MSVQFIKSIACPVCSSDVVSYRVKNNARLLVAVDGKTSVDAATRISILLRCKGGCRIGMRVAPAVAQQLHRRLAS